MIPEDWELVLAGDIGHFGSGSGFPVRYQGAAQGDYPFFKVSDMSRDGNELLLKECPNYITDDTRQLLAASLFPPQSITFAKVGAAVFLERKRILAQPSCLDNNMAVFVPTDERVDILFAYYWLLSIRLSSFAHTTALPSLSSAALCGLNLPLPPLPEQHAIVAVLSHVDELIKSLGALIAKKLAIKQAVMLGLLSGRTRLPGFGEEWKVRRLGDHLTFLRHGNNSRSDLTMDGTIQYLHYGDIHSSVGVCLDPRVTPMPTLATEHAKKLDRLDNGDLVFVDASEDIEGVGKSVELRGLRDRHVVSGLHTIAVRFNKSVLADGFKAYLQFCPAFLRHLRRLAAGTKVYATNRSHIASAHVLLPPLPEQRAIATVLSDMDAEIAALEHRLDKTRAIKQGMMQQLLTGSIRLPIPEDAPRDEDHDA